MTEIVEQYTRQKYLIEDRDLYPAMVKYKKFHYVFLGYKRSDRGHLYDRIILLKKKYPKINLRFFNRLLKKSLDEIHKRVEDEIFENSVMFNYMITSAKSNIKFPVEIEIVRDRKHNVKEINAIITTVLDKVEHLINTKNEEEIYINEPFVRLQEFNAVGNYSFTVDLEKGKKRKYFDEIEIK
ncbi:MAG: hypothetical protein KA885_11965 [Spirochaetes bacterium]|nr:hypothetical protein [Spirochaetota bacterium]